MKEGKCGLSCFKAKCKVFVHEGHYCSQKHFIKKKVVKGTDRTVL